MKKKNKGGETMEKSRVIKERPSKYILKYGRSLEDLAKIFGVCEATIYNWLKDEKKKTWLESILKNL